jgi:hypothetical protein
MNRFSTDIVRGDVRYWREMADTRRYRRYLRCAAVAGVKRVEDIINLLQFVLPCGNGKHPQERYEKR